MKLGFFQRIIYVARGQALDLFGSVRTIANMADSSTLNTLPLGVIQTRGCSVTPPPPSHHGWPCYFILTKIKIYLVLFQDHISVFVLNGYEELESFQEIDESELDYLGINEVRKRSIIMSAVEWLQDTASGISIDVMDLQLAGPLACLSLSSVCKWIRVRAFDPKYCSLPVLH